MVDYGQAPAWGGGQRKHDPYRLPHERVLEVAEALSGPQRVLLGSLVSGAMDYEPGTLGQAQRNLHGRFEFRGPQCRASAASAKVLQRRGIFASATVSCGYVWANLTANGAAARDALLQPPNNHPRPSYAGKEV